MIVQCATFSKSLNPRNIDKSVSDIRIRIRFLFESSFWISLSGCKLTILLDIQPANRIAIISAVHDTSGLTAPLSHICNWCKLHYILSIFAKLFCDCVGVKYQKNEIWKSWSWPGDMNKTVLRIQPGLFKMCRILPDSSPETRILYTSDIPSFSFVYLCFSLYCDACLKSSVLRVRVKTLQNTLTFSTDMSPIFFHRSHVWLALSVDCQRKGQKFNAVKQPIRDQSASFNQVKYVSGH